MINDIKNKLSNLSVYTRHQSPFLVSQLYSLLVIYNLHFISIQITIDISPPHSGAVHDGLPGNPEIDYQQGMNLNAYWDQFFDRESGIAFYQYIVGTTCADTSHFDLNQTHPDVSVIVFILSYTIQTVKSTNVY